MLNYLYIGKSFSECVPEFAIFKIGLEHTHLDMNKLHFYKTKFLMGKQKFLKTCQNELSMESHFMEVLLL